MAENYVIDVQDSASVESWKSEVQALNEKTAQVVKEAAQALEEFKQTAEGNVFENICDLGAQIISGTTEVMKGMTELLNAVTKLVDTVKNLGKDLVQGVVGAVGKIFG